MNCECPCECSIEHLNTGSIITEYMYGDLLEDEKNALDKKISLFDSIDVCARPAEEFIPNKKAAAHNEKLNGLNQCVNFTCEQYANQLDCLGILGCVWCEIDIDQMILLSPFCTHQSSCFGGTLGANTPYGDGDIGVIIDSILPSAFAAIGPIAIGAVVVLFLVIGFAMYCYRNNLEPGNYLLVFCIFFYGILIWVFYCLSRSYFNLKEFLCLTQILWEFTSCVFIERHEI